MSNIQIPNLGAAIALSGAEQLEAVQSGTSVRITTAQIGTYVQGQYPAPGVTSIATAAPITGGTITTTGTISLATAGVTNTYLASMATKTLKANITGSTAGPTDATVTSVLDTIGNTNGNLLYRNATYWTTLGIGSSNYVLSSTGSAPQWVDVASIYTLSIGTTPLSNGTSGYVLYNNAGILGNFALGTSVQTALGVNVGSAGSFVVNGGVLGTPSSATLTNATGLPLTTGVTGTLPATSGGTAQSTYATGDTLYASALNTLSKLTIGSTGQVLTVAAGIPSWATLSSSAVTTFSAGTTGFTPSSATSGAITLAGTLAVTNGGTGVTTSTGSGNNVLSTSPTLVTPLLGTPTSVVLTNATGLPLTTGVTGTLPIANGGTGQTTANTAFNALAPSQTSQSAKFLTTDGTNTSWGSPTAAAASVTIGTTSVIGGTSGYILYNNAGALGNLATTGTGSVVLATSPTLVTPLLGTPTSVTLTNATGLPLTTGVTGTLPAANGGTAQSTYATGDTLYASALNTLSKLTIGSTGQVLTVAAGIPSWATLSTSAVTTFSAGTTGFTPSTATSGAITLAGTLAVANGGTGVTSSTGTGSVVLSASPTLTGTANFASISGTGNLAFSATAQRITGDMSNSTHTNRLMFQSSTVNGSTTISAIPNGSGTTGQISLYSSSDPDNSHFAQLAALTGEVRLSSSARGTGTYQPITFYASNAEKMRLDTSALTLSVPLTYGGVTLANSVQGTGSMVLSASPTLTGTLTVPAITASGLVSVGTLGVGTTSVAGGVADFKTAANKHLSIRQASDIGGGATAVMIEAYNDGAAALIPLEIEASTVKINPIVGGAITLSGATTMSNALTYGGVTLSNSVTGTGSMVLSASPTFTGTLTAPIVALASGSTFSDISNGYFIFRNSGNTSGVLLNTTTDGYAVFRNRANSADALITAGAATFSGALTYGGVTLSNSVTGTGSMVLSASPTFTGTPVLSTPTATSLQVKGAAGKQIYVRYSSVNRIDSYDDPITVTLPFLINSSDFSLYIADANKFNLTASLLTLSTAINYGGVTLSNSVTGTGSMVLSSSPVLTKPAITSGANIPAQGRLTLTSATPVLTATVSAATTIYYALYKGNLIPIYDGTNMVLTVFTELSNATAQSTTGNAGPAVVANNSNYDLFVWSNSGTVTLTRGPLWTSDTARSAGTALTRVNGVWTNAVAITNGPGISLGTYVGTVRSNGTATIDWIIGAAAAGGTAAVLNVWNAYNRISVRGMVSDTTASWTYTGVIRPANNSTAMRVSFVAGLAEDYFEADYAVTTSCDNFGGTAVAGVGYDSTTVFSGRYSNMSESDTAANAVTIATGNTAVQPLGFHYIQALERSPSATQTWYGRSVGVYQNGLKYGGNC